jgi:hypothetical protein
VTRDFCKKRVEFVGVSITIDKVRKMKGFEEYRLFQEGYTVFPTAIVPSNVIAKVKQVRNNGRLDGPFVGIKSEFMEEMESKTC